MASCGDNTDFSVLHRLTAEEEAEIKRQDSIKNAQLNRINADLLLEYAVEITISQTSYDGATLPVEINKIAELFGISETEILTQIANGMTGDISGFAIAGTTHEDVSGASNTNAPWGHWWDANGDITTWGESAMVFAEFDAEAGAFAIGQYPTHLTDGQLVTFVECLKYNEKRVAVIITITAKAPGQITATVVNTQQLNIQIFPKSSYDTEPFEFDLAKTLSDLNVASMDEVAFIGVNADGSYAQEVTMPNGYWYDVDGFVGSWGDNARVYTSYGEELADNQIGIGQMPGMLTEGDQLTIKYGFLANNKIEMLQITITVVSYEDPETPPEGEPESVNVNITLTKPATTDYGAVYEDVKNLLRNAFKKTTYQLHQAIASGELKMYLGTVGEEAPVYTATAPGYWIMADGTAGEWATSAIYLELGHSETELLLQMGNHPENLTEPATIPLTLIIVHDGTPGIQATLNITVIITEAEAQ
jgi:hypothetical protein